MESISQRRLNALRCCFVITGAIGLLLIAKGMTEKSLRPSFQLDVVLTEEELQDEKLKEQTYAILEKLANISNPGGAMCLTGIAITTPSIVGLLLLLAKRTPSASSHRPSGQ